ncbi:MAG: hypothetical protein U5R31_17310 [Acidimicrobiia bacterium]|nr:hypothetical protein [Acidimicrobiia bacterium]
MDGSGPAGAETEPLLELRSSALGGDVDESGARLIVHADHLELRDSRDRVRGTVAVADIVRVEVRRRFSSTRLVVHGPDGRSLEIRGVKSRAVDRFRSTVADLKLPPEEVGTATMPTAAALRRLDELAAMGLLTPGELADRRASLARGET